MERFDEVKFEVKPRKEWKGQPMKKCVLDRLKKYPGAIYKGELAWMMDEADKYPGEWAITSFVMEAFLGISWIAEGDVEIVEKIN